MRLFAVVLAPVLVLAAFAAGPAAAAEGDFARLRGMIAARTVDALSVATREGPSVDVRLLPGFLIAGVEAVKGGAGAIAVGDYVGVGSLPPPDGPSRALEVLVFPKEMEGTGEGSYPWDLVPGSVMTNGYVSGARTTPAGRVLTLDVADGPREVLVPPDVPVVTFVDADLPDLSIGKRVFVPAMENADGELQTDFVAVETGGTPPPM